MTFAERMRNLGRTSGYLAIAAALLWAVFGIVFLNKAGTITPPTSEAAAPGEPLAITGDDTAFWGTGDDLIPNQVTCDWITDSGNGSIKTDSVEEPRPVTDDKTLGQVVLLATSDTFFGRGEDVTCTGGGLEGWALGPAPSPDSRGVGIGFLAGSGFAALWAVVALRVTRSTSASAT